MWAKYYFEAQDHFFRELQASEYKILLVTNVWSSHFGGQNFKVIITQKISSEKIEFTINNIRLQLAYKHLQCKNNFQLVNFAYFNGYS